VIAWSATGRGPDNRAMEDGKATRDQRGDTNMGEGTIGRFAPFVVLLGAGLALAGCESIQVASVAPTAGVTAIDAPAGSNEDFILNVGRRVYFNGGSADLTETAQATLDKQVAWLSQYPSYKIKLEGFADDPGSTDLNMKLGLKRAQAVMAFLAAKGIPAARMHAKSFGNADDRLVKKCPDVSCWSQNRRAVTVLDTEVGS
jgi:peptidoglycan-associated lipoprotein